MKKQAFDKFQIIPSIRRLNDLEVALASKRQIVLLTEANIANLQSLVEMVHAKQKKAWVNLELLGGFGRDQVGMKLLKNYYHVDGVMSTDSAKLGMAKRCSLVTVQRFLIADSRGYDTSLRILESTRVDAAEILPAATAMDIFEDLRRVTDIPLLAGGFIQDAEAIAKLRELGYNGITISKKAFW
ncbi:MAG: glycerol-3-phosphate responsive antiterminator [Eubacterium sp.]|nr:glycerol-3-phosphate responsive antiterminator [Eubacterium sp.]